MKLWTCKRCRNKFEPINNSRICLSCKNTECIDCHAPFNETIRSDRQRCNECHTKWILEKSKQWYLENKDKKRDYDKRRRAEKTHLYRCASKKFRDNNPAKKRADTIKRRHGLAMATPKWASVGYMNLFYKLAKIEETRTGRAVHVDHIYPIKSDWVCGLHCEDNMQLLFAEDNLAKNNHYSFEHEGHM